jgi:hypothetical protein
MGLPRDHLLQDPVYGRFHKRLRPPRQIAGARRLRHAGGEGRIVQQPTDRVTHAHEIIAPDHIAVHAVLDDFLDPLQMGDHDRLAGGDVLHDDARQALSHRRQDAQVGGGDPALHIRPEAHEVDPPEGPAPEPAPSVPPPGALAEQVETKARMTPRKPCEYVDELGVTLARLQRARPGDHRAIGRIGWRSQAERNRSSGMPE